jgi:APA family basic amino acid/polyamine antiporter
VPDLSEASDLRSRPRAPETGDSDAGAPRLARSLGPLQLVLLGVGCIVGAGVYVMSGVVAANYAGPAVILSFALAALSCGFVALCYAELAGRLPVAGSAYSYTRFALGRGPAWAMGWLLLLEYGASVAGVSAGWAASVTSLLADLHISPPPALTQPTIQARAGSHGLEMSIHPSANLLAAFAVLSLAGWLLLGIRRTAALNAIAVVLKVGVLLVFLVVGVRYVHPAHWSPFIPPNEGGSRYGVAGVIRGASAIFFSYIGFEAVSTAAGEARDAKRSLPIGILGALAVCAVLYMATAAVLTGIVPYRELNTAAPIALAATRIGMPWFSVLIKVGSIAGLTSVMLVLLYGQTRVLMAMAQDGLIPPLFGRVDPRSAAPVQGTLVAGGLLAVVAALLPIELIGDLVSLGTATAFALVCVCLLRIRRLHPEPSPSFRAPGGSAVPVLGIASSLAMAGPVILDMAQKARHGDPTPALILVTYIAIGIVIYAARQAAGQPQDGRRGRHLRERSRRRARH